MSTQQTEDVQRVRVVDVDISFWNLTWLFVKASIAVIPAIAILATAGFVIAVAFAGFLATIR